MESWAAVKIALSQCGVATSSCQRYYPLASFAECHVSHVCQLFVRVIIRRYKGLCTYILAFTLQLRRILDNISEKTIDEGFATSNRLKQGALPPNEVGMTAQHVWKGNGWKEGKDEQSSHIQSLGKILSDSLFLLAVCQYYNIPMQPSFIGIFQIVGFKLIYLSFPYGGVTDSGLALNLQALQALW